MAGKNSKKSRGVGGAASGATANAKPRQMSQKAVDRGIKTTYKASGLLVNNAMEHSIRKMSPERRVGFNDRIRERIDSRREDLFAARKANDRSRVASSYRTLRKTDPALARKYFQTKGRLSR